jgi:hypothetical protein|tara:strand:+ start:481 stop:669 length:189 start_codon:yes stop_codon:yes gene_type:complete
MIKEYLKVIGLGLVWFFMNWKSLVFYVLWAAVTLLALFEGGILSALFVFVALWGIYKIGKLF